MIIRVRESKHASYTPRKTFGQREPAKSLRPFPEAGARKRGLLAVLVEDRRRKIVHPSVFSSAASEEDHVRQRHGSTRRRRLREADGISCSRISINQVTMRQRPAGDGESSCTELARRRITTLVAAPQRVFIAIGKGRERHGEGIYRSRDRWHARFRPATFPAGVEKRTKGQWRRASRRPVDIASKLLAAMCRHLRSFPARYPRDYELQRINLHGRKAARVYRNTFSRQVFNALYVNKLSQSQIERKIWRGRNSEEVSLSGKVAGNHVGARIYVQETDKSLI